MQYWLNAFTQNYANFNGRARRTEYWMFALFQIILLVLLIVLSKVSTIFLILYIVVALASLVPGLAMAVRRMHDLGKSGVWILIGLVPFIGGIWLLVLLCTAGNAGSNQFGADPKAVAA